MFCYDSVKNVSLALTKGRSLILLQRNRRVQYAFT